MAAAATAGTTAVVLGPDPTTPLPTFALSCRLLSGGFVVLKQELFFEDTE